ncbi:TadE/TadG family type IV pilus assembly protein [Pseudooceanicola sp. LIPI14-2-Ac024]|uniref:TadE/TadG family type IV pilus assembly protein n=1 Tax=Pseudooceanicola sp. LIPI14-2-Ac024 TaxID=3344875 RepID=UPI0035D02236
MRLQLRRRLAARLTRFARDEDGVMIAVVITFMLIMLIVGGVGVDIMRQEMVRARVQTTLDRAVLAAADLEQELDPEAVVRDYFVKAGIGEYLTNVTVDQGEGHRIVSATANGTISTQFLSTIGFNAFTVSAFGQAEESLGDAEISLVLDISGSMRTNGKIGNLQTAAEEFIDTVILDDTLGAVSINLIPYTAQVNAGAEIMNRLNVPRKHNYSSCVLFESADFNSTAIDPATEYEQAEHFELYGAVDSDITNPGCPMRSYEEITAYSEDKDALKDQIGDLTHRSNTSIHLGMKWAVGMLDPSFRPVISDMIDNGLVDEVFEGRPTDWDVGALKTVILMTDGENVNTYGLTEQAYGTPSMRAHWAKNAVIDWLDDNDVPSSDYDEYYFTRSTWRQSDTQLQTICDAAKDAGVLVWSVGFEVGDHGASVMRNCASSAAHFFRVEGVEISEAFRSIARQLNKLKLTH